MFGMLYVLLHAIETESCTSMTRTKYNKNVLMADICIFGNKNTHNKLELFVPTGYTRYRLALTCHDTYEAFVFSDIYITFCTESHSLYRFRL